MFDCGGDGEEGVGEQGEGGPAVPGGPGTDLVLVQTGESFAGLEILLHVHRLPATWTTVVSGAGAGEYQR